MSDYQRVKLEDVDDWLGDYPGEMRGITYAIGAEQAALTYRRMPQHTGGKGSYGHRHKTQEEVYVVLSGSLLANLEGEVVELRPFDALRVPKDTMRGFEGGPEGAELIAVGAPHTGPGDAEVENGWWGD